MNWVTFGTVNVVATLVAFKIMRPAYMKRFRRDVLNYVVTGAFIGSAAMSLLFTIVYFTTNLNTDAARSALSIFATFFGILIMWNTFGIDVAQPRSLIENWRVTLIGLGFTLLVILSFYILPDLFEFVPPTPEIIALIVAMLLLVIAVFSWSMRFPVLIKRLWDLFAP
jgi:hypothetical protein